MGCLFLEIKDQSCLVGSVDQGLMKNRQIDLFDRMTKKEPEKKHFTHFFPKVTLPGIFQQITPKIKFGNLLAILSIVIRLSRMQLTLHATRRTPHGSSRLLHAMSAWSLKPDVLRPGIEGMRGSMVLQDYGYA